MSSAPIEQKSYEMPLRDGFSVAQFITVADIDSETSCTTRSMDDRSPYLVLRAEHLA